MEGDFDSVGATEGNEEGKQVGDTEGKEVEGLDDSLGACEGDGEGAAEGVPVGDIEGLVDSLGVSVGDGEGAAEGELVGESKGAVDPVGVHDGDTEGDRRELRGNIHWRDGRWKEARNLWVVGSVLASLTWWELLIVGCWGQHMVPEMPLGNRLANLMEKW